ncbi:pentapeptide repeat-containing protein [Nostoc parmelioides FACHB-3921]|uniref:Pentapeptide repeat-containing protein n=2 Tax=Nostoc TaxID=1177 RepID=A0ABR8BN39_9NOSO|nr:pentapeptide repeat-containing protein [Nostoc parmelioides FACHB-3921]
MIANNGNKTNNGTKPEKTQFQTVNTTINDEINSTTTQPSNIYITTFNENKPEKTDPELNKLDSQELTLFRPIELFAASLGAIIIPCLVAWAGWHISNSQFNTQQTDNKHTILKEYIEGISTLSLDKDLTENEKEVKLRNDKIKETFEETLKTKPKSTKEQLEVFQSIKTAKDLSDTVEDARTIAKGQTRTALRRLDGEFKGHIIRFLHESKLIKEKSVIILSGADITDVKLRDAPLEDIQLEGSYMTKADFSNAGLQRANLQGAYLDGANFQGANLQDADLRGANLQDADFRGANLQDADFRGANFQSVNFQGANLQGANIQDVNNWQHACYDEELNEYLGLTKQDRDRNCKDKEPF